MLRASGIAVAAASLWAGAAGVASAAPPWSPPRDVGPTLRYAAEPSIAYGTSDIGQLWWGYGSTSYFFQSRNRRGAFAILQPDAQPGPARRTSTVTVPPVRYATSRVLYARSQLVGATSTPPRVRVGVSFGAATGRVGRFRALWTGRLFANPVLAANEAGDAVIAWVEDVGNRTRVWIARRRAGRSFGSPEVIRGTGRASGLALAVGRARHLAVAYQRASRGARGRLVRHVEVRSGGVAGGVRRLERVGRSLGFADVAVATSANGRTTVVFGTQDSGEEANRPYEVWASVKPAGRTRFRSATRLDRGDGIDRPMGDVRVVAAPTGTATAAWTMPVDTTEPQPATWAVRAAVQDPRARFQAPQELDRPGGLSGLAVSPDGAVLATWERFSSAPLPERGAGAALRPRDGAFGPSEVVTEAIARDPAAAFEPRSGLPVVAWVTDAPDATTRQVRVSARTG